MARLTKPDGEYTSAANLRLKAYEDTGLEPEEINAIAALASESCAKTADKIDQLLSDDKELKEYRTLGPINRLRELVEADREGRCVVLPIPLHRMLLDVSDPYRPEVLRDFRISATWTHRGIVFYSPWNIFLQDIEKGYIRLLREDAEAALKVENNEG